jgi:oligopeptide/dipeptide ABC transporter ATP-binding protein
VSKLLEVRGLKTYFEGRDYVVKAVDDVSYDLEPGETLGLVGESGCGKSVSALSLLRLLPSPPSRIVAGEALFNGQDLLKLDNDSMRKIRGKDIAMIFQEPMSALNPLLTIGRQLTEMLELHLGMVGSAASTRAGELLEMVGIPDASQRLSSYPHEFSGGMRQRVMIAIALSCNPKILLADEPTTALDVTIQAQILELIKKLCTELGTAVVIITHNLGVVARYADRVNVMYAGKIIERGDASSIYANPCHPYTVGLLKSVPRLDADRVGRLESIKGMPPDLDRLPSGCAFRPRCPYAIDKCATDIPPLEEKESGHMAACWVEVGKPRKAEANTKS